MDTRNPDLNVGDIIHGFRVTRREKISTLQLVYYELEHETIGTRWVHLSSDDDNNVFMVTLPTHPENSTGVAHILEHGVLEGSKKYPVKIFKNLSGRSLNTFLNAMTSSDYTAYPFASRNKVDYFNMMNVYMDAVFFPLLSEETFLQEGWRYAFAEPTEPDSPLQFKGVVFNEMKGAMGNPLRLFHENLRKALFPDLLYRHASGGDPKHIPDLTYEEWKAFHARFYHPSNAFFYTYGIIPIREIAARIHENVSSQVKPSKPADAIPRQPDYDTPKKMRFTFPVSKNEDAANKAFIALLWKLIPVTEFYENLKLSLLDTILTGSSAAVLNRTLLESGLGGGLAPVGFQTDFSESIFGAGLKDTNEADADAIEELILNTLEEICREGFDPAEIDAAIHELEFSNREIKGDHGIPFGLSLAFRGMKPFLEGGDFAETLKINEVLETLREDASKDGFFESLIRSYLLDNPHRITMILAPDVGGMEQQEIVRRERLDNVRENMTPEDVQAVIRQSRKLLDHQNDEGNTDCLPQIKIEDISPQPDTIPQKQLTASGIPVYQHDIRTNGISYMTIHFDREFSDAVPVQAMLTIGILPELGAGSRNYVEMSRMIRERTGGISVNVAGARNIQTGRYRLDFDLSSRCLPRNHAAMLELMQSILQTPDLANHNRILELLNMQKAYAVPMASFRGHRMASLAATRCFSPLRWIQHHTGGMEGIKRLMAITPDTVADTGQAIRSLLNGMCAGNQIAVSLTGHQSEMDDLSHRLGGLQSDFRETPLPFDHTGRINGCDRPEPEAWVLSTDVSYVVQAIPTVHYEHPDAPYFTVLGALMEMPMYELIRAQGGAYGAFAGYDSAAAVFQMMTYRDPHTALSLENFGKVLKRMADGSFTEEKLRHAKINVISRMDTPPSPREKGMIEFHRALSGITYAHRRAFRERLLNTTRDDIVRIVNGYLTAPECSAVAVVTSDDILQNAETRPMNLVRRSLDS